MVFLDGCRARGGFDLFESVLKSKAASGGEILKTGEENGASEGIRTLDTHVGNVMLYQAELRSLPETGVRLTDRRGFASPISSLAQ
jgi:hypothetical protein